MTEEDALLAVQQNMVKIRILMEESAKLMDEHSFSVLLGSLEYIPHGLEVDDDRPTGLRPLLSDIGIYMNASQSDYERYFAGRWLPSSEYKGC